MHVNFILASKAKSNDGDDTKVEEQTDAKVKNDKNGGGIQLLEKDEKNGQDFNMLEKNEKNGDGFKMLEKHEKNGAGFKMLEKDEKNGDGLKMLEADEKNGHGFKMLEKDEKNEGSVSTSMDVEESFGMDEEKCQGSSSSFMQVCLAKS